MEFALSEEQALIQSSFRDALERLVSLERVRLAATGEAEFDADIWQDLCAMRMPGLIIPEQYGGAETLREQAARLQNLST